MTTRTIKKRGAQPANTNALKHGVYSRFYSPSEIRALDRDVAGSLQDELEILRLFVIDASNSILDKPEDSFSFHDNCVALRTISVAVARLENLIQVRFTTFGDPDRREQQVDAVLALMERSDVDDDSDQGFPSPNPSPSLNPSSRDEVPLPSRSGVPASPPSKKKSGAQPGNSNAYKHGFYAHAFTASEKRLLRSDEGNHLIHEETLIRVLVLRTWRSYRLVRSSIDWQENLYVTRSVTYAVHVIARLKRLRRRFFGDRTDLEKDIQLGLSEACADLGIQDYFNFQVEK